MGLHRCTARWRIASGRIAAHVQHDNGHRVYERTLSEHGVKVVSITQQTAEDSSGQLARRIFSAFDEYQSQENSKHTSRAMRERSRGFFNGPHAPCGFRMDTDQVPTFRPRWRARQDSNL